MKPRALVTGATGHIGNNLCRALIEEGRFAVRVLLRKESDRSALAELPVESCYGDVLDYGSFLGAARGCDYIFHLAAVYSHNPNARDQICQVARCGTEHFIRVCREAGTKKAVYTSSVAALGVSDAPERLLNEHSYASGPCEAYTEAKLKSLLLVEEALRQEPLPIVIVLPSTVIGENDPKITPSNHLILRFANGCNWVYISGGINVVHISNVVEGHTKALTRGRPGQKYILGGANVTIYDLMCRVASLTQRRKPFIKLGRQVIYPVACVLDLVVRLTNKPAPISKMQAKTRLGKFGFYSIDKAQRELDYFPLGVEAALKRSFSWYRQKGLCKR
jgi:dihydroflavonol-4-reductase